MRWLLLLSLLAMLLLASAQASLVKVGAYDTRGYAKSVVLTGSYAYVADGYSGLQIIDISSPTSPFLKGTCNTPGYAHGMTKSDSHAYIAAGESGLQIIDIISPVSPTLKGTFDTSGTAYGVALSGSNVFVADGSSGLQIIDISSPASPTLKGTFDTSGTAYGVALSGSNAFVADGSFGLQIIDISSPSSPALKGTCDTSGTSCGVALSGSNAYLGAGNSGLQIIDIIDPDSPSLKGTYNTQGAANHVALSGSYAYVADGSSGLQIIDIDNPAGPLLKGTYDTPGTANDVALSGSYAYVADGDSGLQILAEGASLQGKAWHDRDCDGLQDLGEPSEPDVLVKLLDGTGSPIAGKSTTTGSDGSYSFLDLVPGDYYAEFSLHQGYIFSPKNQGADEGKDSDANSTGRSDKIILSPGQSHSLDAGIFVAYSITGIKFNDVDGDGTKDTDESGLAGWKIYNDSNNDGSFQEGEISAITAPDGAYYLANLVPGTYNVREVQQTGWAQTTPSGGLHSVVLTNANVDSINFGNRGALSISGMKFHDKNANGQMDDDEPTLSSWDIQLKDSSDNLLQTATTSSETGKEGGYEFEDLQPGTYRVYEVQQTGWVRTVPVQEYYTVTLTTSPSRGNIFGNDLLAISGVKFEDLNCNSAKDSDDPELEGWTIKLKKDGTEVASTSTNTDGTYSFTGIAPGSYTIEEDSKQGWAQSYPAGNVYIVVVSSTGHITITKTDLTSVASTELNFGNVPKASISGMKFEDLNRNGARDSGEPGLEDWTIKLKKEGTEVASTLTVADGAYSFTGITPGSYTLEEVSKQGWTQSYPASPGTQTVTLVSGVAGPTDINFGNLRTTGFAGMKFEDLNGNGARDSGEPGLEDWTIKLKKEGTEVASTLTVADGAYSFTGITPGSYTLEEVSKQGWTQSYPASPGTQTVTLVSGVAGPTDINFGNLRTTGFAGMKFEDLNGNGARDSGEPGLEDWTIKLKKGGTEVASTLTVAGGAYSFTGITPGGYTVEEVVQDSWTQTYPASPGTQIVTMISGVAGPTNINFGNLHTTGFAGMKFEDLNGNGAKDNGEPGLEGWTIKLKKEGTEVTSTPTVAGGAYSFTGITPGSYTVEEVVQDGWAQTYPAGNVYTVVVPNTGQVTVKKANQTSVTSTEVNFGNVPIACISGMKFEDLNGNGQKDTDEMGLKDGTIRLQSPQIIETTATTGQDGSYQFQNLPPGDYTVSEDLQSGWLQTSPAEGSYLVMLKDADISERDFGNRKLVEAFQVLVAANPQTIQPGQEITFTIIINRQGDILLDSLGAKNTLPKGLKFISSNPRPQSVTENADGTTTLTWTDLAFGSLIAAQTSESQATSLNSVTAPSPSTSITVTAQAQSEAPESLTCTVVITGSTGQAAVAPAIAQACVKCLKRPSVPVKLNKTSDLKEVWPGATVSYTITYTSMVDIPLTDLVIVEQSSPDLIFISATPAPDRETSTIWTIGALQPHASGTINVLFLVKETENLNFSSQSHVQGNGFMNSYRRLSTDITPSSIKNRISLCCKEFGPIFATHTVQLLDADGTSILKKEHGSGSLQSEEISALCMKNKTVEVNSSFEAVYLPTAFDLPRRSLDHKSRMSCLTWTKNRATDTTTSQEYWYADSLVLVQKVKLDKNGTDVATEGSMQGRAHLSILKKEPTELKHPSSVFESTENYVGAFRFNQILEDYGSNVRMIRNATGLGWAANDLRLKKSQRSYEHGFGSYESEELISTAESFIAKDLFASYDPQYGYGKWKAGIWSKSPGQSFLGQEIDGAGYIREETKAEGLSDLSTNLSFQGRARLRAASEIAQSEADLDEEYVGQYSLQREVHLRGVSRFDRPHLTLNKTGRLVPGTAAADYTITVLNDGNAALGPVYVWDIFPAGTDYLSSSLKPDRLQPGYANWSLLYLGIGQSVNINLRLNVTDPREELVNVVYASGGHNDQWISAGNMRVMQFGWLGCCQPEMLVEKQARIDAADSRLIWYRILLKNQANVSLVAQVTDRLPTGLQLLNVSAEPQVEGPDLAWVTTAIPAGESRFIEYRAQATKNGKFVNTARVEAHALDGSGGASLQASATVTVGEAISYAEDGWRPMEWELDRSEIICDDEIAGSCVSCLGGSCPLEEL